MFIKATIKVTKENTIWINLDNDTMVTPCINGTTLHFTGGGQVNVVEDFDTIRERITFAEAMRKV